MILVCTTRFFLSAIFLIINISLSIYDIIKFIDFLGFPTDKYSNELIIMKNIIKKSLSRHTHISIQPSSLTFVKERTIHHWN